MKSYAKYSFGKIVKTDNVGRSTLQHSKLSSEQIPENNDIAKDADDAVKRLTDTSEKIAKLKSPDEGERSLEVNRCNEQLEDLNDRWKAAKEEIARQLATLDTAIDNVEKGMLPSYFLLLLLQSIKHMFQYSLFLKNIEEIRSSD